MSVPDPEEEQQDFIIEQPKAAFVAHVTELGRESDEELTLDDITATPREKSREDIIAEAEAAAFAEA